MTNVDTRQVVVMIALVSAFPAFSAEVADQVFENMPFGCFVVKSEVIGKEQTDAIASRLGTPIAKLSNTYLRVQGTKIQVNVVEAKSDPSLLAATSFWPVDDPEIQSLAGRITSGRETQEGKVQAILEWLTPGKNIKSGGPTGSRWGVHKVLSQKYGHCWDASDCFVTLARAAGIPSRQVAGWLYGESGHVWAEVLTDGTAWKQVDPTGGGKLTCGIYHIPYFTTESGEMPILYLAMPTIDVFETK